MRLLVISDSPRATTGFGTVSAQVLPRLAGLGADIDLLALYDYGAEPRQEPWGNAFPVAPGDSLGFGQLAVLLARRPQVILMVHELVYCHEWARRIRGLGWIGPVVGFFPVYGPVLSPLEKAGLSLMDERLALSRYGASVVRSHGFWCEATHLGVDHQQFKPAPGARRKALRRRLGWERRFVVAYVARNRWNKQQPKLLEAARLLKQAGEEGFLFYLHCCPTPQGPHWVPGMGAVQQEYDLRSLGEGLEDWVVFPQDLRVQESGIPCVSLVERLQAADCVAHVAHAEGFGLPLVEAMACGLPVLHTEDGRVMSEVVGPGGRAVHATGELVDAVGNRFADVPAWRWAEELVRLRAEMSEPPVRRALRRRARRRSLAFRWDETAAGIWEAVRRASVQGARWRRG